MESVTVVLDQLVAPVPGGIGRYALNLVRAVSLRTDTPRSLVGFVPRVSRKTVEHIEGLIPLLDRVEVSPFPRAVLARAWERGLALPKRRLTYSPSLFTPASEHGHHIVTIHDAVPWTHPDTLTGHGAEWHRAMGERAARFADVIVVPTQAVAHTLSEFLDLGDRVRVIGGAPSPDLVIPVDSQIRRHKLAIPDRFVVFVGTLEPRKGLEKLLESIALVDNLDLVIVGPTGWGGVTVDDLIGQTGVNPARVHTLGRLGDADLAAVVSAARALVVPSIEEGFGLPVLEAMSLGVPVIHSTAKALTEVAGRSAVRVNVHGNNGVAELAEALTGMDDETLRRNLISRGRARAALFSWDNNALLLSNLFTELA